MPLTPLPLPLARAARHGLVPQSSPARIRQKHPIIWNSALPPGVVVAQKQVARECSARSNLNSPRHLRSSLLRRHAPSGLELRANSIGAFSGFHEATPLTSSAERATGVT